MNVYGETDYRLILEKVVTERKKVDSNFRFHHMAAAMRIQKSYLSRVIHGRADLNSDQVFLACRYLNFDEQQTVYMELLLEHSKSTIDEKKKRLTKMIRQIQAENLDSKKHFKVTLPPAGEPGFTLYYVDPLNQIVHICLLVKKFRDNPVLLAEELSVPPARLLKSITTLEKLGIISQSNGKISVHLTDLHLPKDSEIYNVWRDQLKLMSLQRLKAVPKASDYSFSMVFSGDLKTKEKIQRKFLELLSEVDPSIAKAPDENVFQLTFDLFGWTGYGEETS